MTVAKKGTVYLVGAGPGDPELLTLKAADLLATADVVLHDDLVPQSILDRAASHAIIKSVGKRCGRASITQDGINSTMIAQARQGRSVVRLKSGDPLVFGRAGEEIDALEQADVPFEVVSGVTAMFAAAAAVRKSLTDRRSASKLVLVTAHHATEKSGAERVPLWRGTLPSDATLGIYMPGRDLSVLAWDLFAAGLPPELPCVLVSRISLPDQQARSTTLEKLASLEPGDAPLLVLAGWPLGDSASVRVNGLIRAETFHDWSIPV
jgi:uroporphyrin-III C-methyltransferase